MQQAARRVLQKLTLQRSKESELADALLLLESPESLLWLTDVERELSRGVLSRVSYRALAVKLAISKSEVGRTIDRLHDKIKRMAKHYPKYATLAVALDDDLPEHETWQTLLEHLAIMTPTPSGAAREYAHKYVTHVPLPQTIGAGHIERAYVYQHRAEIERIEAYGASTYRYVDAANIKRAA